MWDRPWAAGVSFLSLKIKNYRREFRWLLGLNRPGTTRTYDVMVRRWSARQRVASGYRLSVADGFPRPINIANASSGERSSNQLLEIDHV